MAILKYTMSLNKKYVVTTYALTYVNKSVEVVGIVNYQEALKLDDIKMTGLNEKIIDDNYDEYFQNIEFYKCKIIGTENIIILWSDIIDPTKTSLIGEKYSYKMTLEIDMSTNVVSKDVIINSLIQTAGSLNATLNFKIISEDENSSVDIFQERIAQAENVLRSLNSLAVLTPVLDSLNRDELTNKIDTININIDTINDKLETIATGL